MDFKTSNEEVGIALYATFFKKHSVISDEVDYMLIHLVTDPFKRYLLNETLSK